MTDRTYTSEELKLELAAKLREAAKVAGNTVSCPYAVIEAIDALSTDQSALDRFAITISGDTLMLCIAILTGAKMCTPEPASLWKELKDAIDRHDAALQAQCAAVMEMAAGVKLVRIQGLYDGTETLAEPWKNAIRALIPSDWSAALAERVREAKLEEAEWWEPYLRPHVPIPCQQRLAALRAAPGAQEGKP